MVKYPISMGSFNEGDYVTCMFGFNNNPSSVVYGGAAYSQCLTFKISRISKGTDVIRGRVLFNYFNDYGVWEYAVRYAEQWEIDEVKTKTTSKLFGL